jgi:hypothetical protein
MIGNGHVRFGGGPREKGWKQHLASGLPYPAERWFIEETRKELEEGRRVMFYFEQNAVRSMARRLEFVLKEFNPWTLPNSVEAEDRQQAILDAVERGHNVVIVPYRRVNEGLNLQKAIDTIVWAELAMNLFYFIQASQRAWRLGKENLVKILIPYYLGSAAHKQVRRLGEKDGAAAAFAGEPAKGGLAKHVGADQTTLNRLSAQIEAGELASVLEPIDDSAQIEANFARRNEELAEALRKGRQWFGVVDTLSERLTTMIAAQYPDMWASLPAMTYLPEKGVYELAEPLAVEVQKAATEERDVPTERVEPISEAATGQTVLEPRERVGVVEIATETQVVTVTFGDEEDIRRVRKQRQVRPRRTYRKPKNPLTVKDIAAVDATVPQLENPPLLMASIWDFND